MTPARRQTQTRPASAADARAYLDKAREFLRAAEVSLGLGNVWQRLATLSMPTSERRMPSRQPEQQRSGRENTHRPLLIWRRSVARRAGRRHLISVGSSH
jgi:hypothetical protein